MNALLNGFETSEATFKAMSVTLPGRAVALKSTGEIT